MPLDDKTKADDTPDHSIEDGDGDHQRKDTPKHIAQDAEAPGSDLPEKRPDEHGGQKGPEPTRYGDWEKKGRCTDF